MEYAFVSYEFEQLETPSGVWRPVWRDIPPDHGDLTIRAARPGRFAVNSSSRVAYILRKRRS